jgi:hypothetical protein
MPGNSMPQLSQWATGVAALDNGLLCCHAWQRTLSLLAKSVVPPGNTRHRCLFWQQGSAVVHLGNMRPPVWVVPFVVERSEGPHGMTVDPQMLHLEPQDSQRLPPQTLRVS